MDYEPWSINYCPWTIDHKPWTMDYKLLSPITQKMADNQNTGILPV